MSEDKNNHSQMNNQEYESKKRRMVILLFVLALVSTVAVSFILQHNISKPTTIDNIPIESIETRNLHVSGQVLYKDGMPFQNGRVQMHSDVMNTLTDKDGWFLFKEVTPEEHEIQVLDEAGSTIAKANVSLKQDSKEAANLKITKNQDGSYIVNISNQIRYLELALQIKDDQLLLMEESSYAVTDNGKIYNPQGVIDPKNGTVILENGTVITESNMIIHFPYAIDPDNNIVEITDQEVVLPDHTKVDTEGTITLPDGTIINGKKDTVTVPDNNVDSPNEPQDIPKDTPSQIDPDGNIKPVKPTPPDNNETDTPSTPENPNDPETPDIPNQPNDPDVPDTPDVPNIPDDSDKEDLPKHPELEANVVGKDRLNWGSPWNLSTPLDLFYTGGNEKTPVIQPGSSGYYLFRVENNRDTELVLNIQLSEDNIIADGKATTHLPFQFRLGQIKTSSEELSDEMDWSDWEKTINKNGEEQYTLTLSEGDVIKSKLDQKNYILYRLEWQWPYESGNDASDTKAGENGFQYKVDLKINLEEKE